MDKGHILLLIFSFFVTRHFSGAFSGCSPASCGSNEPEVRFPFCILDKQLAKCGFPGFNLSCNEQNRTIIQLPSSLSYMVKEISYAEQFIDIDPEFCEPNRIVGINVTDTPFGPTGLIIQNYTFFNCSQNYSSDYPYVSFPCLSSQNYTVIAIMTNPNNPGYLPSNCTFMNKTIAVPVRPNGNIKQALSLMWSTPYCKTCEREGKACEWKSDIGETICVNSHGKGISKNLILGLSIGIGVPVLLCTIGFAYYIFYKVRGHNKSRNPSSDPSSVTNIPPPASVTT